MWFTQPPCICEPTNGTYRLKGHADHAIPDEIFEGRFERWPEGTPDTKEAYYLRDIFDSEIASSRPPLLAVSANHIP